MKKCIGVRKGVACGFLRPDLQADFEKFDDLFIEEAQSAEGEGPPPAQLARVVGLTTVPQRNGMAQKAAEEVSEFTE